MNASTFRSRLEELVGLPCSMVTGTADVGSMITLHFGETTVERVVLPDSGLLSFERSWDQVTMWMAPWRLRSGETALQLMQPQRAE